MGRIKKTEQGFKEGDIYIVRNDIYDDFYRIKKTTESSVMVEKLGVDFTLEFDEEDFKKTCMKEENFELCSPWKEKKEYRFIHPKYKFILKEIPNNEVVSTIRMTIEYDMYDDVEELLLNKSRKLEIDEKFSGNCVEKKIRVKKGGYFPNTLYEDSGDKTISEKYKEIIHECFRISDEMTKNYYKTPKGIKEEEEYNTRIEEEKKYKEELETHLKGFCKVVIEHKIKTGKINPSSDDVEDYIESLYKDCWYKISLYTC